MPQSIPRLVTVADLARTFDLPEGTLRRIMRLYKVQPTAKAAHVAVFDRDGIARVRHAVNAYQAQRAEEGRP